MLTEWKEADVQKTFKNDTPHAPRNKGIPDDSTGWTWLEQWTMGPTAWLLDSDNNNDDDKVGHTCWTTQI